VPVLTVQDPAALLRAKAGRQVLIRIKPAAGGDSRDAIVTPISLGAESDLRYHSWEYTRRLKVDELSKNQIGYLHLRAMGGSDFTNFVKGYYPVFDRQGLIIDVRNNRGGNIDSWILSKLMRKAWMTWSQRVGQAPNWNMQYAFRGHMILLCNERTASDGEAIADGFRRLGLGKVLGTRTWGGEIWLTSSNTLVDRGIATAGEFGVWGPEGTWLIEGRGVEPDIVIDNPPHATFKGEDAQLKAAVDYLQKLIAEKPIPPVERPAYPDKSFRNK
jgi:tricorn protease